MTSVLGPFAMNEDKFATWFQHGKALGLLWDTASGIVRIPPDKLAAARNLFDSALAHGSASCTNLLKLFGRLRHVSTCFADARAFFQRLQGFSNTLPRLGRHRIPMAVMEKLTWFRAALRLDTVGNSIPVDALSGTIGTDVHVFMDASNTGLCSQPRKEGVPARRVFRCQRSFLRSNQLDQRS